VLRLQTVGNHLRVPCAATVVVSYCVATVIVSYCVATVILSYYVANVIVSYFVATVMVSYCRLNFKMSRKCFHKHYITLW